jgi:hypothetical protein
MSKSTLVSPSPSPRAVSGAAGPRILRRLAIVGGLGALTAVIGGTVACDPLDLDGGLGAAVPTRGQVRLNVPGADDDGGQALRVGSASEFHAATVRIANQVNGGVGNIFRIVEAIRALPPADTDGATYAVWGPSEPRGLERNSFRFTVNKVADGEFDYRLEARPKDATTEDAFVVVFEGTSFPSGEGDGGHGELDVHWGALRSLDDTQCMIGDLHVVWAGDTEPRTLDVTFLEAADGCRDEAPTNATYHYVEAADGAGSLDFAQRRNVHQLDESKPLEEVFAVRSRWLADGAGRSDVRIAEGEIATDLAANLPASGATTVDVVECWDASFTVVHSAVTPVELAPALDRPAEGDVAQCAFAEAEFASL